MTRETISKLISIIGVIAMIYFVGNSLGWYGLGNGEAKKTAEAHVNKQVYSSLGVPAKNFSSKVIYNEDNNKLIVVKYSLDNSSNWGGACCVHYKTGTVFGCTSIMPSEYDYENNIDSLKAMFGIY